MTDIKLSICIPTYNFGAFIGETLRSVIDQLQDGVEIVVLDGASTDNTEEIVRGFQQRCSALSYHRLGRKGGIDNDLARTVELARGDYCWLLSSDDVPTAGAIARMLGELSSNDDIYLCNRIECDRELRPLRTTPWLGNDRSDHTFTFDAFSDISSYFRSAISIGAFFSYISSIVVRRDQWISAAPDKKFIGSNYAHAARLFSILLRGGTLRYIREPLVLCRGENDSFSDSGVVRRFLIDLDGYLLLSTLFQEPTVRDDFLAVMRREHPWYVYAELRSRIIGPDQWRDFEQKLIAYGYGPIALAVVRTLGGIPLVMIIARMLWFGTRRVRKFVARLLH
jgi:abequosyltransferase